MKDGLEVLQVPEQRFPTEDPSNAGCAPAAHRGPCPGAGGYVLKEAAAPRQPMQEQVFCGLWEGPTLEKFMKDCTPQGTHTGAEEKVSGERICSGLTPTPQLPIPPHCLGRQRS